MSILIFLGVLFVLILVHEWGHYITAKLTGMRVDEFGIGFPPKLFGVKRGETTYTFNALPIGGFVKILGENGDANGEVLSAADKLRTFNARPKWAQAVVLFAGVTMNVLFAWLLFVGVLMMGAPTAVGEDTATAAAKLTIASVVPNSPAASLPANAVVESLVVGDTTVSPLSPKAVSAAISGGGGLPVTVTYVAGGREQTETLQPVTGLVAAEPERYTLGVQLILVETIVYPFGQAVVEGTLRTYDTTVAIIFGLSDLLYQAVRGEADFSQVAGPVGIVNYVGDAAQVGLSALLVFTAIISLNLAVINLLPIPALDGGRLVFVAIEAVTRRPINPAWAGRLNLVGFALLMLLMLVVTYNDIVKLF